MIDAEFQAASLAIREWALWVAMVQVAISAIQTGIVYYGIRAMVGANAERVEAAAEARREAERDRAERAEAAAEARREADRRHAEAMQASAERHAESMAAINAMAATLAEATTALKVVVERAAPGATPSSNPPS